MPGRLDAGCPSGPERQPGADRTAVNWIVLFFREHGAFLNRGMIDAEESVSATYVQTPILIHSNGMTAR
jgi:hypothetical protein